MMFTIFLVVGYFLIKSAVDKNNSNIEQLKQAQEQTVQIEREKLAILINKLEKEEMLRNLYS